MLDPLELLFHVRLNRSPPIGVRIAIALLGGLVGIAITGPIVRRLWGRPEPVEALADVVLRVPMERVPWARIAGIVGLGMLVGVVFEVLSIAGERLWAEPVVIVSELTVVDATASLIVMGLVFAVGVAAVHVVRSTDPDEPTPAAVYRRWLLVSVGFVAASVWAILVLYDLFGIAGVL